MEIHQRHVTQLAADQKLQERGKTRPENIQKLGGVRMAKMSWIVLAVCVLVFFVMPYIFAGFIIVPLAYRYHVPHFPDRTPNGDEYMGHIHNPQINHGIDFEEVEFEGVDGSILRGWWVPGTHVDLVVITVHGASDDRREFLKQLPVFHSLGLSVLMFDCREHGLSDGQGRGISYSIREHADVLAAVRYVKEHRGARRVALVGTSQGGSSSLLAAANSPDVTAVIAENPFSGPAALLGVVVPAAVRTKPKWGAHTRGIGWVFSEIAAFIFPDWYINWVIRVTLWRLGAQPEHEIGTVIHRIAPRPVLLMHGTNDTLIPLDHSQVLHEAALHPKELWVAEGASHAKLYNMYQEEWTRRVQKFLTQHMLEDK